MRPAGHDGGEPASSPSDSADYAAATDCGAGQARVTGELGDLVFEELVRAALTCGAPGLFQRPQLDAPDLS